MNDLMVFESYSLMDKMRDPALLKTLGIGEKILGSLVVMVIGMLTCIVVLFIITLAIKLLKYASTEKKALPAAANEQPSAPAFASTVPQSAPVYTQPPAQSIETEPGSAGAIVVTCPMPGTILSIDVQAGAQVKSGDVLIVLEAMKMENEIIAPEDGVVAQIAVTTGMFVNSGDALIVLSAV